MSSESETTSRLVVAVLGLGEAGSAIARDLAASRVEVRGWDPAVTAHNAPVPLAGDAGEAVRGADVVLSVNSSSVAMAVAEGAAAVLGRGQIYADLNTGTPQLKERLAEIVQPSGSLFADVALMAPVPGRGIRTPALVAGEGAERFAELFVPLGMPVERVGGGPGGAAARKLLRSVFMKGFAAAIVEGMAASERFGCLEWFTRNLIETIAQADASFVRRLALGSRRHAKRRTLEMQAAAELLLSKNINPRVCMAAAEWLHELSENPDILPIPDAIASEQGEGTS